jgi:hypothetical protein
MASASQKKENTYESWDLSLALGDIRIDNIFYSIGLNEILDDPTKNTFKNICIRTRLLGNNKIGKNGCKIEPDDVIRIKYRGKDLIGKLYEFEKGNFYLFLEEYGAPNKIHDNNQRKNIFARVSEYENDKNRKSAISDYKAKKQKEQLQEEPETKDYGYKLFLKQLFKEPSTNLSSSTAADIKPENPVKTNESAKLEEQDKKRKKQILYEKWLTLTKSLNESRGDLNKLYQEEETLHNYEINVMRLLDYMIDNLLLNFKDQINLLKQEHLGYDKYGNFIHSIFDELSEILRSPSFLVRKISLEKLATEVLPFLQTLSNLIETNKKNNDFTILKIELHKIISNLLLEFSTGYLPKQLDVSNLYQSLIEEFNKHKKAFLEDSKKLKKKNNNHKNSFNHYILPPLTGFYLDFLRELPNYIALTEQEIAQEQEIANLSEKIDELKIKQTKQDDAFIKKEIRQITQQLDKLQKTSKLTWCKNTFDLIEKFFHASASGQNTTSLLNNLNQRFTEVIKLDLSKKEEFMKFGTTCHDSFLTQDNQTLKLFSNNHANVLKTIEKFVKEFSAEVTKFTQYYPVLKNLKSNPEETSSIEDILKKWGNFESYTNRLEGNIARLEKKIDATIEELKYISQALSSIEPTEIITDKLTTEKESDQESDQELDALLHGIISLIMERNDIRFDIASNPQDPMNGSKKNEITKIEIRLNILISDYNDKKLNKVPEAPINTSLHTAPKASEKKDQPLKKPVQTIKSSL